MSGLIAGRARHLRPAGRSLGALVLAVVATTATQTALARPALAQDLRLISSSRRATVPVQSLETRIQYIAGRLSLRAGGPGRAYALTARYDDERFRLLEEYDPPRLTLGLEGSRGMRSGLRLGESSGTFDVRLGPDIPMRLAIEFGAGQADLDLGGLNLESLKVSTGASETRLVVSQPTAQSFERAELEVGAAEFEALELGNLQARRIDVAAGIGELVLDFSGQLIAQTQLHLSLGLGDLELRIPKGVGVRVTHDAFLASVDLPEMNERDGVWYSPNWSNAEQRIEVDLDAAFGEVRLVWLR